MFEPSCQNRVWGVYVRGRLTLGRCEKKSVSQEEGGNGRVRLCGVTKKEKMSIHSRRTYIHTPAAEYVYSSAAVGRRAIVDTSYTPTSHKSSRQES